MDDDSPSRRKEKWSKRNQDYAAAPKLTSRTKVACPHDGAGGSHARAKGAVTMLVKALLPFLHLLRHVPLLEMIQ